MSTNQINNNKKDKKITSEQTIILIRLIKKYKCLWNPNCPDFRNRALCNELYEKIGSYFQLTGEEVKRKYRRLRNCYVQELRLMRNEQKEYTNLFYFDEMEFLKDQVEERLSKRRPSSGSVVSIVKEECDSKNLPTESFEEHYTIEQDGNLQFNNETESHPVEAMEDLSNSDVSVPETRDIKGSDWGFESKTDEFNVFAEYLASQLREMDKLSALETMDELQRIVSHRRIELLKKDIKRKSDSDVQSVYLPKKSKMSNCDNCQN